MGMVAMPRTDTKGGLLSSSSSVLTMRHFPIDCRTPSLPHAVVNASAQNSLPRAEWKTTPSMVASRLAEAMFSAATATSASWCSYMP